MINKLIKLPTGYLFTGDYSKGQLETLSIGDYGKSKNVKADFLGYTKEINGVANGICMPLSEKWVLTLSTQYGCNQRCTFCSVPNIKFQGNASYEDLEQQFINAIQLFPDVNYTERLNIHFARMGEPIYNKNVFEWARNLYGNKRIIQAMLGLRLEVIHPVLTTSLPNKCKDLGERILEWCDIKNELYNGQAGFQFSINSTDEDQRNNMFVGMQTPLAEFAKIAEDMPMPIGRKYCLNFAYCTDYKIDGKYLASLFDPEKFMCKITPIHNNEECIKNKIETIGGYTSWEPYRKPEESLKKAGFDVLVFVPSMDEEDSTITCGNVILGGSTVKNETDTLKIEGC